MKKTLCLVLMIASYFAVVTPVASAENVPSLSTCLAPNTPVKTAYSEGIHGIPGDTTTYSGSDKVYEISPNYSMQCFCAENGTGVQTDWVKASNFSEADIKVYVNQGWIYIPNGADWGLSQGPYLAKNSSFSCKSSGGSSSSSSSSSSNNDSKVGGASASRQDGGSVLSLANTGNIVFLLLTALLGVVFLATSIILRKKT